MLHFERFAVKRQSTASGFLILPYWPDIAVSFWDLWFYWWDSRLL